VCLAARTIEASGIPTIVLGSARDILVSGAPPRVAFLDYPLGHSAGRPFDPDDQYRVVRAALEAVAQVREAGTIVALDGRWSDSDAWRDAAMRADGPDTRTPRADTPQYQTEEDRRLAEPGR
jgi:D-proline reductase (dithiol) PrdB